MNNDNQSFQRQSIRLKGYDYTQEGLYFVTICTFDRLMMFGDVQDQHMQLNESGKIVKEEWLRTAVLRPDVRLDKFVIMPNHFHGIIEIERRGTARRAPTVETFGKPVSNSIPTIIRSFKSAVTKNINSFNKFNRFIWQRNYYEHIIRNDDDLTRIQQYITDNPLNWEKDRNNVQNLYM